MRRKSQLFYWDCYSKKSASRIESPRCAGVFLKQDAEDRGMHYAFGNEGSLSEGNWIQLHCLLDPSDGIIVDAKFQAFGLSALIAAADAACEILIGKTYIQAGRLSADLIDRKLRDAPNDPALPDEVWFCYDHVLNAIDQAMEACTGLPLPSGLESPVPWGAEPQEGIPEWKLLSYEDKLAAIEKLLDEEIRPYIEMDAGGIEIVKLVDDKELMISYQGACTSCYSAVGSTLSSIQQIVQARIHPEITVVPNLDDLQL